MAICGRSIITLAVLVLVGTSLPAQASQPVGQPISFRVLSMADVAKLLYDIDGKEETVYATTKSFSQLYPIPPDRRLRFYREEPNPEPGKPPLRITIAEGQLPKGMGPFLVLLSKNPTDSQPEYEMYVIDQSLDTFPENHYRIFNFSDRRMAVQLAGQEMLLSRTQSQIVPYSEDHEAWLKVAAENDKEGWLVVTSSSHAVGADSRTTIFLIDIPPSERDPDPLGIVVRKMREQIVEDEFGVKHVQ